MWLRKGKGLMYSKPCVSFPDLSSLYSTYCYRIRDLKKLNKTSFQETEEVKYTFVPAKYL